MVSVPQRFFRGIVQSSKFYKHPNFYFILIDTVREIQHDDGFPYTESFDSKEDFLLHNKDWGDVFYGVYGSYWIDIPKSPMKITETYDLKEAIKIAEEIMGSKVVEVK